MTCILQPDSSEASWYWWHSAFNILLGHSQSYSGMLNSMAVWVSERMQRSSYSEQCGVVTCAGHGEQQQCGGVQGLSCHEESARVGVGAHRLRVPAEGKHQTQSTSAHSHEEGENSKHSLCFQHWKTHNDRHTCTVQKERRKRDSLIPNFKLPRIHYVLL